MKHLLRGLFIAVLFICCNFQLVLAQPMQELPVDKNVRIGKLDNGLTYYIRHNALPEKRVEFYIAQKVGSILEEPQQRGLAHFLEHMAFNGTKTSRVMRQVLALYLGAKRKVSNSVQT